MSTELEADIQRPIGPPWMQLGRLQQLGESSAPAAEAVNNRLPIWSASQAEFQAASGCSRQTGYVAPSEGKEVADARQAVPFALLQDAV